MRKFCNSPRGRREVALVTSVATVNATVVGSKPNGRNKLLNNKLFFFAIVTS